MRLVSINVGLPRAVQWKGRTVSTGIFKVPVEGPVELARTNLAGDRQADLEVHGGPSKAVLAYPVEHYGFWRQELPGRELPWGAFGENFSVEGLDEGSVAVGDAFEIGTARVVVTQPRVPCFKLGIRFGDETMLRRALESRRLGFYFAVEREGTVTAGDRLAPAGRDPRRVTVADLLRLYLREDRDPDMLARAIAVPALTPSWRRDFERRLAKARSAPRIG